MIKWDNFNLKAISAVGLMSVVLLFMALRFEHLHSHHEGAESSESHQSEEKCVVCDFHFSPHLLSDSTSISILSILPSDFLAVEYTRKAHEQYLRTTHLRGPPASIL